MYPCVSARVCVGRAGRDGAWGMLWRAQCNGSPACVGEFVPDVNIFSLGLDYILLFLCLFSCLSVRPPQLRGSSLVSVENDRSGFNARAVWGHVYR